MSVDRCLPELLANGSINQDQADRMGGLYRELEADLSTKFGREAAAAKASEETVRILAAEAAQVKRQSMLQIAAQQRITSDLAKFNGDKGAAALALFDHDDRAPYSMAPVEMQRHVIQGQAHAMMTGVLEKHSRNLGGRVRNRAALESLVREAFGEDSGDLAAKQLSDAWGQTAEMLRTRFNAAGGAIGKLENWGLPQTHNMEAVRAVRFEEWRDFIAPRLDREKMLDPATGLKMTPQGMETSLRSIYEKIRSDGWIDRAPGGAGQGKKLANRHAESRFLAFKDAQAWMEYSRQFGRPQSGMATAIDPDGPIFDAMMGHISSMSRDIALAEVLGPNPTATIRWLKDGLQKEAALSTDTSVKSLDRAEAASNRVQLLYDEIVGTNARPVSRSLALGFSAMRSWQTAAKLGSATLSAVTDIGFQATTRAFDGLPITGAVTGYLKLLKPGSRLDRELAVRIGLVAEEASKMAASQSRYTGEVLTGEMSSRLAEGVLRASGLSAWTEAGRWAFGMEFLSHITHESGRSFDQLSRPFRRVMERYGFGAGEWDALRSTPQSEHRGANWIMPEDIENRALADKLLGMVISETNFAVPVASLKARALMNDVAPKGTWIGEFLRSALQFKSFGISMVMTHGARMMQQQGWDKLKYAAGLTVTTTLMGAMAYQLKSIARGQDPAPMEDPTFWAQAMMQGGGIGIYGDFINSATSKYGNDIYSTLLGPMVTDGVNLKNALQSEHPGRGVTKMLRSTIPGSSLWYSKLAFQRSVLDQLQREVDPDYDDAFDAMEQRARKAGQEYYWRPGEAAPTRSPVMSNMLQSAPDGN